MVPLRSTSKGRSLPGGSSWKASVRPNMLSVIESAPATITCSTDPDWSWSKASARAYSEAEQALEKVWVSAAPKRARSAGPKCSCSAAKSAPSRHHSSSDRISRSPVPISTGTSLRSSPSPASRAACPTASSRNSVARPGVSTPGSARLSISKRWPALNFSLSKPRSGASPLCPPHRLSNISSGSRPMLASAPIPTMGQLMRPAPRTWQESRRRCCRRRPFRCSARSAAVPRPPRWARSRSRTRGRSPGG